MNFKTSYHLLRSQMAIRYHYIKNSIGEIYPYLNQEQRNNYYLKNFLKKINNQNLKIDEEDISIIKKRMLRFSISKELLNTKIIEYIFYSYEKLKKNENIDNNIFLTSKLHNKKYRYYDLIEIYNFAKRLGLFNIGLKIRDIANNNLKRDENKNLNLQYQIRKIGIYAEENDYEKCIDILNQIEISNEKKIIIKNFLKMLFNQFKLENSPEILERNKFYNNMKNKNVCLIASANFSNLSEDLKIKPDEIIGKFGYKDDFNKECHISFYNHGQVQHILENNLNFPKELEWIVVRNSHIYSILKNRKDCLNKLTFLNEIPFGFFDGVLQNLQRTLIFLSNFKFNNIKVFNADLHQSLKRSNDSMTMNDYLLDEPEKLLYKKISIQHDPITAKKLMINFVKNKLIIPDERLDKILKQSDDEFMNVLTKVYI